MVILTDMDDTMEDLLTPWMAALAERWGVSKPREEVDRWDIPSLLPELTPEQIYAPLESEELWTSVRPLPGAAETLERLAGEGHQIYVVTASSFQTAQFKAKHVLIPYFPFIPIDHVIVASKKQMVRGDVLIDDGPHNLLGGTYQGILFDAPHNRTFPAKAHGLVRAKDWAEVYDAVQDAAVFRNRRCCIW